MVRVRVETTYYPSLEISLNPPSNETRHLYDIPQELLDNYLEQLKVFLRAESQIKRYLK